MVVPACFPSFNFSFKFIRITKIQNNNKKRNEIKKGGGHRGQHGKPARPSGGSKNTIKSNSSNSKHDKSKHDKPKNYKPKHNSSVGKHSTSDRYKHRSNK